MQKLLRFIALLLFVCWAMPSQAWWWNSKPSDYAKTRYPIVLVHGMFGFDNIGPLSYWYGIPDELRQYGATVFVVQVPALDSTVARGEALLPQVEQIAAIYGKVNLIGHSHGGPTARYVAHVRPDLVASVTTVASPNTGSPVADLIVNSPADTLAVTLGNALGSLIDLLSSGGYQQNMQASLQSLSSAGSARFNSIAPEGMPKTPCGVGAAEVHGVHFYSWGGTAVFTNVFDPSDALLGVTSLAFGSTPNDGLVGRCSNHFGDVLRDNYNMNHLDEVNQLVGLHSLFETDPKTIYLEQANRLKNQGL